MVGKTTSKATVKVLMSKNRFDQIKRHVKSHSTAFDVIALDPWQTYYPCDNQRRSPGQSPKVHVTKCMIKII